MIINITKIGGFYLKGIDEVRKEGDKQLEEDLLRDHVAKYKYLKREIEEKEEALEQVRKKIVKAKEELELFEKDPVKYLKEQKEVDCWDYHPNGTATLYDGSAGTITTTADISSVSHG